MDTDAVLIVDSDKKSSELLSALFSGEGLEVACAADGEKAISALEQNEAISVLVLDVLLPEIDGWQVISYAKERFDVKILVLTTLSDEYSEARAFRLGADDYVIKPYKKTALIERVRRLIKENERNKIYTIRCRELVLDLLQMKAYIAGERLKLTSKEYHLLRLLMQNSPNVLPRSLILEKLWGYDYDGNERTVDTHIKMLRRSIGEYGALVRTVRKIGYSFDGDVERSVERK